ncbi:hypothetical protein BDR22DRAFT_966249 [Usnea florida]
MAEQQFLQSRPFMSKETFDQVSAAMWGRNDYDYHASYIFSRTEWYDDDIRDETLYATGLAYGLRLAALERTSQPVGHQNDRSGAFSDEGGCQLGCTSQCDPRFGKHYCYTPHVPQSMAQTPPSQSSRPVLSFGGVARTPSESAALKRQASMLNDRSAPRQDSRDYAIPDFGTERPYAKKSSSQLTPLGMALQPPYTLSTETEVPGMKLPGNLKAVNRPGQGIVAVSGTPTSPDGRNVRPSQCDSPESRLRAKIPLHEKSHSSAAARSDKSVRLTTVANQWGFEVKGGYANTSIQPNKTESSKPEGSETDNEDWVDLGMN